MKVKNSATHWTLKDVNEQQLSVPKDGRWTFNGNNDSPTFTPSINESWGGLTGDGETIVPQGRNHYIITDGKVFYCEDSTHKYAGQTVDIVDLSHTEEIFEKTKTV